MLFSTPVVVDTNVLLRGREPDHPQHASAKNAVSQLARRGVSLHLFPQNVREFWNVATRPASNNGLGMTVPQAERALQKLEAMFIVLGDGLPVYQIWRQFVLQHQVSGVKVHDCYIAAAMAGHGLTHLLTFNTVDFVRYGITAIDPASV